MIDGPKVDNIKKEPAPKSWSKDKIGCLVKEKILAWVHYQWATNDQEEDMSQLVSHLMKQEIGGFVTTAEVSHQVFNNRNNNAVGAIPQKAVEGGVVERKMVSKERKRVWKLLEIAIPPWIGTSAPSSSPKKRRIGPNVAKPYSPWIC